MSDYPALAIGAIAGGPGADSGWADAVRALGRRVIEVREGIASPLAVNVVYQIPGQFLQAEFEGVRTGGFSRKEARLLVQVALPPEPSVGYVADVRRLLAEAVGVAEDFAQQEGMIAGELMALRELLGRL